MKDLSEVIVNLDNSTKKLLNSHRALSAKNAELLAIIEELKSELIKSRQEIASLKEKYQRVKVASALGGSDEGVRETKLRINRLVREIDSCIQLMQG